MIQMFSAPSRSLMNAMRVPSGLKRGWKFHSMPSVSASASPPSMPTR
jgi:hypothetical protein